MKEILQLLGSKTDKGRDVNRTAVLGLLVWLVVTFKDIPADVKYLKDHRCRCGQPAVASNTQTNATHAN